MKILVPLFCPPGGTWGSLTRVLAVGHAATARGHQIAFCAAGPLGERLTSLGYRVFPMPQATYLGLPSAISKLIEARSQESTPPVKPGKSFGSIWLVLFFTGSGNLRFLKKLVREQLKAVEAFKPDLIFTEGDLGAMLLAQITGLPFASTYASVFQVGVGSFPWKRLRSSVASVLRDYGKPPVDPHELIMNRQTLKLIPSVPEMEEVEAGRDDVVFTGSLYRSFRAASDAAFEPEPGKRYVFVYVGTGSMTMTSLRKVLPVVFPEGAGPMCLVGAQSIQGEERLGNVVLRPFWDAETLLPHCDWTVCHGGHNTIIQSLSHGVPLLVFPGPIFERRFNAQMVHKGGAGRWGEVPDFRPDWLAEALRAREGCAERAKVLGKTIASLGGADTAICAMERWAGKAS
ncbi:MAG: hypothetical protein HY898_07480 [Deltaproteobacteria bacterium]|nr:hypothetical protein [Deltaproteobacteria bacterium]